MNGASADIAQFLAGLAARDVIVTATGDRLRCSAPRGGLSDELLAAIGNRKPEILAHLRGRHTVTRHEGTPPLSYAQERFWLLHQFDPGGSAYHLPLRITLRGKLQVGALRWALGEIVRRHDVLRTRYVVRRGRPEPVVGEYVAPPLPVTDLSGLPAASAAAVCAQLAAAEAIRPFDLATGPVLRARLLRHDPERHTLLLTRHHVAWDGWSLGVLFTELGSAYAAHVRGRPPVVAELPVRYGDFAAWQRARVSSLDPGPWREFDSAPTSYDLLDPVDPDAGPTAARVLGSEVALRTTAGLREWAADAQTTVFTVLFAVYGLALASMSGQRDLVIGTPVTGRAAPELEPMIGCFVNTLPVRLDFTGSGTLRELVRRTHDTVRVALAGQDMPFERVLELVRPERALSANPLFEVAFAYQNTPAHAVRLPGVAAMVEPSPPVAPKFPLLLTATDNVETIDLEWEFDPRRVPAGLAEELRRRVHEILRAGLRDPRTRLSDLERALGAAESDSTAAVPPPARTLTDLVAATVAATPDAIAVSCGARQLTYRALARRADRLADTLWRRKIRTEERVGLLVDPGIDLVVGALGILRAGAAYLPLDPDDPPERVHAILTDAAAPMVVTDSADAAREFERHGIGCLRIDRLEDPTEAGPTARPRPALPANLAYVVYTSGSTGEPKGVAVTHANVTAMLAACRGALAETAAPRVWALTHSAAFDFSVWEMWGALTSGGRLAIVPPKVRRDPTTLWRLIRTERVAVLGQTPSAWRYLQPLVAKQCSGAMELVVLGGEALAVADLAAWFDAADGRAARLVNMYGITETTVHATHRTLRRADVTGAARSPIGSPLPGQRVIVADEVGGRMAIGGRGEIVVGGAGVARGYLGRPGPTARRFRPAGDGARVYRSGDVARVLPGAELDYLGRIDQQVKIRGHRVETGAIEAAVLAHPSVGSAAVVARVRDDHAELIAYLVSVDGMDDAAAAAPRARTALRAFLADRLPRHMIPAHLVFVDRIPLTRNGKRDVAALPQPAARTPGSRLADTATERRVAAIVSETLGVGVVGAHDNFFDLGGDSLRLIQLHARLIEAFRVDLPVRRIHRSLDVATLARTLDEELEEQARITEADILEALREAETHADLVAEPRPPAEEEP
ncbi:amino acid adenylation domain-containing protein [Nocardia sp. NPDC047038]|uniref:non-ribosomal peptide synthetase n=1 Tax=Nocardia sp. NPDC047038 TaxID=3154338 RepID=UPI0033C465F2